MTIVDELACIRDEAVDMTILSLREKYMYGCCMWLAIALHDLLGWPIEAMLVEEYKEVGVDHAYILVPGTELAVDIYGLIDREEARWSVAVHDAGPTSLTREGLIDIVGEDEEELREAHRVAIQYILGDLAIDLRREHPELADHVAKVLETALESA